MMQEQQKNLKAYLNNIPYDKKDLVREHILKLLRQNESIPCVRCGVAKNIDDSYYCYIEATGFTAIGKELHQIRILFPHNYPTAAPQFHLLYKEEQYRIENEALLLKNGAINFEKSPANEVFINLQFPFLNNYWRSDKRNVADAYREIQKCLNNPPLLVQRIKSEHDYGLQVLKGSVGGSLADKFMYDVQVQALQLQDKLEKCEKGQREIDYSLSRVDFLKRNIPKLTQKMKNFEQNIANKVNYLQTISEPLTFSKDCDSILDITEQEKYKLKVLGTREGLKQAQRRLLASLQRQLQESTCKFENYKGIIKKLSEQMFETQLNYLKLSD